MIGAAAAAVTLSAPFVRTAHAAGKLTIGLWDHWVPGANNASTAIINEWAEREKVEVQIDYITTQGNKMLLTEQAEALARTGHDIYTFRCWGPGDHYKLLEPVDDIIAELIKQNGSVAPTVEYLGKHEGHWVAIPATRGCNTKGPVTRIDLLS
jgi:ABC-type glycerol-3-phosphate transport system substrate-binding protein